MLNRHPLIGIPPVETEFLPWLVRKWPAWGDVQELDRFTAFYEAITQLPYFLYQRERGWAVDKLDWYRTCSSYDPAGIFEALIRLDSNSSLGSDRIWGDKSPSYIWHLPLIKNLYPHARFIHIVRDVRDYVISMRMAWSKNPLRAAQRWVDGVEAARLIGSGMGPRYIEIRYEDLLRDPTGQICRCCDFLSIAFDSTMLHPGAVENLGEAAGYLEIKRDNSEKWRTSMYAEQLSQIERIAGHTLRSLGYDVSEEGPPIRISSLKMFLYQCMDAVGLIRADVSQRGLFGAFQFRMKTWRISGNRYS